MKTRRSLIRFSRTALLCLCLALVVALGGVWLTLHTQTRVRLPYADLQLAAARRMERAEAALLAYVNEQGTGDHIDKTHNDTGLY